MTQKEKAAPFFAAAPEVFTNDLQSANLQQNSESGKDSQEKDSDIQNLMNDYEESQEGQEDVPFFVVKSANDVLAEAMSQEQPKPLWLSLWYEGQICCLFATAGSGKSIYAVQIGAAIARERKVLYFDFELSTAQFAERYSDDGGFYKFPDNFYRVEINADYLAKNGMGLGSVIDEIQDTTLAAGCDTIIIDNLTWVETSTEKAEDAGRLMQRLMALKKVYGWSILILAHTPKRERQPISENDLAGSKVLFNFLDSAFSVGFSERGDDFRYIIELKTRMGKKMYGRGNVILTQIVKEDNFTYQKTIGYSTEATELGTRNNKKTSDDYMKAVWRNILGDGCMRYTDLTTAFVEKVKKPNGEPYGIESAKKKVKQALDDGILIPQGDGKYRLSVKV